MHHLDSAVRPAIAATLVAIALRISGVVTMSNLDAIPFEHPWTPERALAWWNEQIPSTRPAPAAETRPAERGEWIRFLKDSKAPEVGGPGGR